MLPVFQEKAASPSMVLHGMGIIQRVTKFLNPEQIPVMALDQPLFALAKNLQWKFPERFSRERFVVMFGGLHIEMALISAIGDLLEGSGWTSAITNAGITSSGVAESLLRGSHVTRSRRCHQITIVALSELQKNAFRLSNFGNFEQWIVKGCEESGTFFYWNFILQLEIEFMLFIRSLRQGNFNLYVLMLERLSFLFFALDKPNYSRWVPIHLDDIKNLPESIQKEFLSGNFVVNKTGRKFSNMAIDQTHEQENAVFKGAGGAIGLTENPSALSRWLLSGPELGRLIAEFESNFEEDDMSLEHHEAGTKNQIKFHSDVNSLIETIDNLGNPFQSTFRELVIG
eukprot:Pompholyxophrys_punicea_v1_NODE_10_length_6905_cov_7.951686.p2 type:complete len:342 gc:universal NODE_10_length_6905_cov_7.951686:5288-4263(-)